MMVTPWMSRPTPFQFYLLRLTYTCHAQSVLNAMGESATHAENALIMSTCPKKLEEHVRHVRLVCRATGSAHNVSRASISLQRDTSSFVVNGESQTRHSILPVNSCEQFVRMVMEEARMTSADHANQGQRGLTFCRMRLARAAGLMRLLRYLDRRNARSARGEPRLMLP
eukprot:30731-Eustigmatos_ZCMA.PRE.1